MTKKPKRNSKRSVRRTQSYPTKKLEPDTTNSVTRVSGAGEWEATHSISTLTTSSKTFLGETHLEEPETEDAPDLPQVKIRR
jgi:hypothetical protein